MSEWWTYTLSDFLLFSARTYYRLFEIYNSEIWPIQILAIALGIAMLVCLFRTEAWQGRVVTTLLAVCWLWVAWAFHLERYATINWAANYFAVGFMIEAALLIWIGVIRGQLHFKPTGNASHLVGLGVFLFALIVQSLIGPITGRPWLQAEIFGIAPDPTVIATLGILLLASNRIGWVLLLIPIIWCGISGATLWVMEAPDALIMPLAALLTLTLAMWKARLPSSY
jgi:hypothetical protein